MMIELEFHKISVNFQHNRWFRPATSIWLQSLVLIHLDCTRVIEFWLMPQKEWILSELFESPEIDAGLQRRNWKQWELNRSQKSKRMWSSERIENIPWSDEHLNVSTMSVHAMTIFVSFSIWYLNFSNFKRKLLFHCSPNSSLRFPEVCVLVSAISAISAIQNIISHKQAGHDEISRKGTGKVTCERSWRWKGRILETETIPIFIRCPFSVE
jgi:hypothetical protein